MNFPRIYLAGFMGSGKSTVGRMVAHLFRWPFKDLDDIIVKHAGMTIPEIFQREGEVTFRRMEVEAVRESTENPGVIALGGGTLLNKESRELLLASGTLVYLRATPETLTHRLQARSDNRPILKGEGELQDRIGAILEERAEIYAIAHWAVDTDKLSPEQAAGIIYNLVMYGLTMDAIDD